MALDAIADGVWRRPTGTMSERLHLSVMSPASMAGRAEQWNTHCISTIPYLSQVVGPSAAACTTMTACLDR
eukprot:11206544-Lingulodinium_polyedra.AAC.1